MPVPLFSGWTRIYGTRAQAAGPLCVRNGQTLDKGIPVYFYSVNHAAFNVTAGVPYFVEIRNTGGDTSGSSGCHWRWAWSNEGTLLYSVEDLEGSTSYVNNADPENTMSLAFGLNIEFRRIDAIQDPPTGGDEELPPVKMK